MQEKSNRVVYLDIAKAIGIILVLVGHVSYEGSDNVYRVIKEFHMPLFFIISGMTFNEKKCTDYVIFVINKIKKLYLPFVTVNIIYALLHNRLILYGFYPNDMDMYTGNSILLSIYTILKTLSSERWGGATWFIAALFWTEILWGFFFWCISHINLQYIYQIGLEIIVIVVAFLLGFNTRLNYNLSIALVASGFLGIGHLCKTRLKYNLCNIFILIMCMLILILLAPFNNVNMVNNIYDNDVLFLIGAGMGTYVVLSFSLWLEHSRFKGILSYIGQHTLYIVMLHFAVYAGVNWILLNIVPITLENSHVYDFPTIKIPNIGFTVLYMIIGMFVPILIEKLIYEMKRMISNFSIIIKNAFYY